MKLDIIFEDKNILVVNKPAGLVVNRSVTNKEGTLQDLLSEYLGLKEGDLGVGERAGIVHRLDRETSGLLVVAKDKKTFEDLQAQFKERRVEKQYKALVHGKFKEREGFVEGRIARVGRFGKFGVVDRRHETGRDARTDFKIDSVYTLKLPDSAVQLSKHRINYLKVNASDYTLVTVFPKTGRTHQIRVHLKSIGHPLVSDLIYGPGKLIKSDLSWCPRLFLHAASLEFTHPKNMKRIKFEAPLPNELAGVLGKLSKEI